MAESVHTTIVSSTKNLVNFLEGKGLEVFDKREKGGVLWVVGGKELDSIIKETRKLYGALWTFSQKGGRTTGGRTSWFTNCTK
jgi:hypothetical protein